MINLNYSETIIINEILKNPSVLENFDFKNLSFNSALTLISKNTDLFYRLILHRKNSLLADPNDELSKLIQYVNVEEIDDYIGQETYGIVVNKNNIDEYIEINYLRLNEYNDYRNSLVDITYWPDNAFMLLSLLYYKENKELPHIKTNDKSTIYFFNSLASNDPKLTLKK